MTIRKFKGLLALIPAALTLAGPVMAQAPAPHPNVIQRHPTATGVAVGVGVHHALKVSAAYKKRHHEKLNFAERHPTITGFAAGVATRHEIKKHTAH
jgi:hypothetical protein